MGILWTESFDWTTAVADLDQKYTLLRDVGGFNTAQARRGDQCLLIDNLDDLKANLPESVREITVGFAINLDRLPSSDMDILLMEDNSGNDQWNLGINTTGKLTVEEEGFTRLTSNDALSTSTWQYVEVQVYTHNTAGSAEIRIDGKSSGTVTGVNTGDQSICDTFYFKNNLSTTGEYLIDDIYMTGSVGTPKGFLGSVYVEAILPNAVGASAAWAASPAASNFQNVDEVGPDGLATYVSSSNVGDQDSYNFGDISGSAGTVHAVAVWVSAKKDAAGSRGFGILSVQGANFETGACDMLTEAFKLYPAFLAQDAASAAWTPTKVNSAEFGIKVTV